NGTVADGLTGPRAGGETEGRERLAGHVTDRPAREAGEEDHRGGNEARDRRWAGQRSAARGAAGVGRGAPAPGSIDDRARAGPGGDRAGGAHAADAGAAGAEVRRGTSGAESDRAGGAGGGGARASARPTRA